jgi:hypothetical protein
MLLNRPDSQCAMEFGVEIEVHIEQGAGIHQYIAGIVVLADQGIGCLPDEPLLPPARPVEADLEIIVELRECG